MSETTDTIEITEPIVAPPAPPPDFPVVASGRRKTSVATAWIDAGTGKIEVNGRPFEEYFYSHTMQSALLQPLQIVEAQSKYDIRMKAAGGGLLSQAGAARMAIARALIKIDPALRPALKVQGCLRRDSRMKERKKSGQPGARKRFQFSKR